jgi:hypothetical protein
MPPDRGTIIGRAVWKVCLALVQTRVARATIDRWTGTTCRCWRLEPRPGAAHESPLEPERTFKGGF